MNEKTKIDINGSIKDAASEMGQSAIGFAVIAIILGFLVAPVFAPLFENGLNEKYRTPYNYPDYDVVNQKMKQIKITLWIICLLGWAAVILTNLYWKY